MLRAFRELRMLGDQHGISAVHDRAREQWLHWGAFRTIDQTCRQIVDILRESGLIEWGLQEAPPPGSYGSPALNQNSNDCSLIASLLLAGQHPNLGAKGSSTGVTFRTASEQSVLMHPSSLNSDIKRKGGMHEMGTLFTFSSIARSAEGATLFMRETTRVTALMAALFGGRLAVDGFNQLTLDWVPFYVQGADNRLASRMILEFKSALDRVLVMAFRSLADVKSGSRDFATNPIQEQCTQRVLEVLNLASGQSDGEIKVRKHGSQHSVPRKHYSE